VFPFSWDLQSRQVQWLGVDVAIYFYRKKLAELAGIHILRIQDYFPEIGPRACVVVLRRCYLHLIGSKRQPRAAENYKQPNKWPHW
jgi:hypothetical protein